ncbi:MAG: nitroreductase family protein, partial [Muribaculaceae bacterium]|nr:nitroreductase family protein [Muribaculaceae bacterium]
MEYFSSRRTIRKYQNKRVEDNIIEQIVADATHCPTTGNMQLYSVVITRDRDIINALSPAHFGQLPLKTCDVVLTICADYNRFVKWCELRDAGPGYDNFQSFMSAVLDATIFAQQ